MKPLKVVIMKESKKLRLNKEDGFKILKGMGLAVTGPLLDVLMEWVFKVDFGEYTHLVYIVTPVIVNVLRKLVVGKK